LSDDEIKNDDMKAHDADESDLFLLSMSDSLERHALLVDQLFPKELQESRE
jgi:hypothetical protein